MNVILKKYFTQKLNDSAIIFSSVFNFPTLIYKEIIKCTLLY